MEDGEWSNISSCNIKGKIQFVRYLVLCMNAYGTYTSNVDDTFDMKNS